MSTFKIKQQKAADKFWQDEAGLSIPFDRITRYERKAEAGIGKITKEAIALNTRLSAFKTDLKEMVDTLYKEFVTSNEGKSASKKGNITLYNFDRSVKVEVNINEPIHFDEEFIKLAKAELDALLADELHNTSSWIKGVISDAFEKSRGELDTDKVLGLKKHASRTTDERYHKAMKFIDQAINRPTSREYYRVWVRGENGQYQNVQLNFSAI